MLSIVFSIRSFLSRNSCPIQRFLNISTCSHLAWQVKQVSFSPIENIKKSGKLSNGGNRNRFTPSGYLSSMYITQHLKNLGLLILRDYSFYHIYSLTHTDEQPLPTAELRFESIEKKEIDNSSDRLITEQAWYHSQSTYAYACMEDSRIVGLCFFWYGEGYRKRNFWPLADQEAKLVQLFVLPEMRGRSIGRNLIQFAVQDMFRKGFKRVYARIWRSNTSSLRAFRQAGWNHIATVIELSVRGRKKPFRLERHRKRAPAAG